MAKYHRMPYAKNNQDTAPGPPMLGYIHYYLVIAAFVGLSSCLTPVVDTHQLQTGPAVFRAGALNAAPSTPVWCNALVLARAHHPHRKAIWHLERSAQTAEVAMATGLQMRRAKVKKARKRRRKPPRPTKFVVVK
ncbi:hypothetical protein PoB_004254100 [Plakobranchus ocellatus]|uniref:Uncharacterized protein n=1 Tax=Plakobranchus ocellatus TaxID=259542 RepID=A0AAV4BB36_9GAST|nr:hypothetical protein PoB_004254100 [Plakobranchus ocellatus]